MAFGSVRKTHFSEAQKSIKLAKTAMDSLEKNRRAARGRSDCNDIYHGLNTILSFLTRASTDLARSGSVAKMSKEDRWVYYQIKGQLEDLEHRFGYLRTEFSQSCLRQYPA